MNRLLIGVVDKKTLPAKMFRKIKRANITLEKLYVEFDDYGTPVDTTTSDSEDSELEVQYQNRTESVSLADNSDSDDHTP